MGIGIELNRMDLSTKAPDVHVPYTISYTPSYGVSSNIFLEYYFYKFFTSYIKPEYSYYQMNFINSWFTDSKLNVKQINLNIGFRFNFYRFTLGIESGFGRYTEISHIQNGHKSIENYLAVDRNTLNSSFLLGFLIYNQSFLYVRGKYYNKDLFISNGFDKDYNRVGPVHQRPIIVSVGLQLYLIGNTKK